MPTKKPATATGKTASKAKAGSRTASAAKTAVKAKATRATAKSKAAVAVDVDVAEQAPSEDSPDCKHSWLIEPPNGPTSNGSCAHCGQTREFRNSYEYTPSWTARSGKAAAGKAAAAKAAASNSGSAKAAPAGKDSSSARK